MLTNQQVTLRGRWRIVHLATSSKSRFAGRIVLRAAAKRSHTCCNTLECNPSTPRAANWMKHPSLLYGLYPLSSRSAIPDLYAFSISRLCSPRFFVVPFCLNSYVSLSVSVSLSPPLSIRLLWGAYKIPSPVLPFGL